MIDAKLSLSQVEAVGGQKLAPLIGLGIAAMISSGLWGLIGIAILHLF
jgi:hypothetical protein